MKNIRFWFHVGLIISFALPWVKIPLLLTTVTVPGYLLPYQSTHIAHELNNLGVVSIQNDQMLPMYVMLLAPTLSFIVLLSMFTKRPLNGYFDSTVGFIAVMSSLYVLMNTGNVITIGLYVTLALSLLLVASPLLNKEKVPGTDLKVSPSKGS